MMYRPTSVKETADGSGNKTNVGLAKRVRIFNANAGESVVTMTDAAGTTIATFNLARRSMQIVWKNPTECFFGANADVEFTAVETRG